MKNIKLAAGIDVGVKNLCWCIIDCEKFKRYQEDSSLDPGIVSWKNVNLIETFSCEGIYKSGKKKGEICGKNPSFKENDKYYCGTHKPVNSKKYKAPNSKSKPVGYFMEKAFKALDTEPLFENIDSVAIELQLRKNPTMKRISNGLEAYFIMKYKMTTNPNLIIKYSSGRKKLKVYKGETIISKKKGNAAIKDLGKLHTEAILKNCEILETCYFPYTKKDDLADSFLHCVGSF